MRSAGFGGFRDLLCQMKQTPPDETLDEVNARLSDGLKTCRSVVANYKALLLADQDDDEPSSPADTAAPGTVREDQG